MHMGKLQEPLPYGPLGILSHRILLLWVQLQVEQADASRSAVHHQFEPLIPHRQQSRAHAVGNAKRIRASLHALDNRGSAPVLPALQLPPVTLALKIAWGNDAHG